MDAIKVLKDHGRRVQLTVVGTGPELENLRSRARRLGVDVDFMGAVFDQNRVNFVIDSSDILVSPLNVGLSAMHSMARGCPVATSAIEAEQMPEAEAVRSGETGVRFDPYSVEAMAKSIWEFVETSDPTTVGNACIAEIRKHWNAVSQSERLIAALLATGKP